MTPDELADALLDRSLPYAAWNHRGHVTAGFVLVRRLGPAQALATLRRAIPLYNESVGTRNTDDAGYHDTITCYFAWAIARAVDRGEDLDGVLRDALVHHAAPLRFWSRERLFSVQARRGWVPPDLVEPGCDDAPPFAGPLGSRLAAAK
jgi:hypothetical protein